MIVRPAPTGCHLIKQPDHARLAARLLERCVPLASRARRSLILLATANHDNGWSESDSEPSVDRATGRIVDFIHAPISLRQGVWPRTIEGLRDEPWAAALVAHHAVVAYDRFRGDPGWSSFFAEMEASRDTQISASGRSLSQEDLVRDYAFVRLGDLLSLAFCVGEDQEMRYEDWIVRHHGNRVVVAPERFGGEVIPFEIAAKHLEEDRFATDDELRAAYAAAPTVTLRGELATFGP